MPTKVATKKTTKKTAKSAFASSPVNKQLTKEEKIELYKTIVGIRRFEERSLQAYNQGKIGGFLHLYIGQEAVAAGIVSLMEANDHIITAYRDHGHALAVGMSMNECMAELYGKYTGCSKGKGVPNQDHFAAAFSKHESTQFSSSLSEGRARDRKRDT